MADTPNFPRPIPSFDAQEYWEGCKRGELWMQRHKESGQWYPPNLFGPCQVLGREWVRVSGRGKVYSYTLITHPVHPAARDRVPYNVIQVQLDEDPELIMVSSLEDIENEDITIGIPVEVVFTEHEPDVYLPKFRPV